MRSFAESRTKPVTLNIGLAFFMMLGWLVCLVAVPVEGQSGPAKRSKTASTANPVLPGDHPDPSIIRVGGTYWTTSTSGDWAPEFPLYRSTDLRHWTAAGVVFPHQPEWAVGSFWAPELVYDSGRVLIFYVGRKRDGPLCVAVATAASPGGPYTDHGPLVCEQDGSIDPAFARDEHGKPFLIWKEDGNSQGKPTPLWAQPLTDDLIHLTGEKTQLLVNEPASWEGGVVEAPYVLRHADRFYLFYAGNACCGTKCAYAEGVARAEHLLGPWEKDPRNPIIRPNGQWRCPGHGSAVIGRGGETYFLYHAYPVEGTIFLGRESVLDRVSWTADGWLEVNGGRGPGGGTAARAGMVFSDAFLAKTLNPEWRWPVNHEPRLTVGGGRLTLEAPTEGEAFVGRSLLTAEYTAEVEVAGREAGLGSLAVLGNAENAVGLGRQGGELVLWRRGEKGREVIWRKPGVGDGPLALRVKATGGGTRLAFSARAGTGSWEAAGESVDVSGLPQWDQGLRVGLVVDGTAGQQAQFARFTVGR